MPKSHRKTKVAVGLSGGVDSSVTAALLVAQGYSVIGVYMKNWNTESPQLGRRALSADSYRDECPWYEDYLDAKRVALQLNIPFVMWDFRDQYKRKVFDHVIDEFETGRTPNPDVYCNNLLKFDDLQRKATKELGVDFVATGHYAKLSILSSPTGSPPSADVHDRGSQDSRSDFATSESVGNDMRVLQIPKDTKKDQTYFLYRLSQAQLAKAMFPLATYTKQEVRELAKRFDLPTKFKKDSVGLCYIGDVELRDFLTRWLAPKKGEVRDLEGRCIGYHAGVHLSTIGQKVAVDNRLVAKYYPGQKNAIPNFYVAEKDMKDNILLAVPGTDHPALYKQEAIIGSIHFMNVGIKATQSSPTENPPQADGSDRGSDSRSRLRRVGNDINSSFGLFARLRHTGELVPVKKIEMIANNQAKVFFATPQRAVTPGQHLVLYDAAGTVLGGGVINR